MYLPDVLIHTFKKVQNIFLHFQLSKVQLQWLWTSYSHENTLFDQFIHIFLTRASKTVLEINSIIHEAHFISFPGIPSTSSPPSATPLPNTTPNPTTTTTTTTTTTSTTTTTMTITPTSNECKYFLTADEPF